MGAFLRVLRGYGHDAHGVPELGERAQDGGLGDLAAELRAQFHGGERAFAFEQLPRLGGERRDAPVAGGGGFALGIALRLERVEIGQRLRGSEEIRVLAYEAEDADARCRAEEIERDDRARCDQAREHLCGGGDLLRAGCGIGATGNGLYEGGRGHREMLAAREIEAERRVGEPAFRIVEREQRVAILTPACSPGLFQLVLIHDFRS
jgi:hypothetical protein